MTERQALRFIIQATEAQRFNSAVITVSLPRYIVRDQQGQIATQTGHAHYARAAQFNTGGIIEDRLQLGLAR